MKITFTHDHQSPVSGNELYRQGAQADLPKGQALIDAGVAYAGWGKPTALSIKVEAAADTGIAEAIEEIEKLKDVNFKALTIAELQEIAKDRGIQYVGLRKSALIEALTEAE